MTDNFTQRLCSIDSDAPLEMLMHIVEKSKQITQCTVVTPDNGGIYILATPCCHEASCHITFANNDVEMDALIYWLNMLESRSQCENGNHSTPISSSHQTGDSRDTQH